MHCPAGKLYLLQLFLEESGQFGIRQTKKEAKA
jgi:hypothetical protein